jgi:multimeric flavodoxin WrbA
MKIFMDRISDYLDLPDLLEKGRKLRGKKGSVICTCISDSPDEPFINAFRETFSYLGMDFGGFINANCNNGYKAQLYENDIKTFIEQF